MQSYKELNLFIVGYMIGELGKVHCKNRLVKMTKKIGCLDASEATSLNWLLKPKK